MTTDALHAFDLALLELDVAVRTLIGRAHPMARHEALRDAYKDFLAAIGPVRMFLNLDQHARLGLNGQEDALALLGKCLAIADEARVPRGEIAALFNRETLEHGDADHG
jgi:hypothetical protein